MTDFVNIFNSYSRLETTYNNYIDALQGVIDNPDINIVCYNVKQHLVLNNLGFVNKDDNGLYFVEVSLSRCGDIYSNFNVNYYNVKVELIVQDKGVSLSNDSIILGLCSQYSPLQVRFTFLNNPCDVILNYKGYVMQTELRQSLLNRNNLIASGIRYNDGAAYHL